MDPHLIALLGAVMANLLLGFYILMRAPKVRTLQSLFALVILTAVWVLLFFFAEQATSLSVNRICNSLTYAAGYSVLLSFTIFTYYFAKKRSLPKSVVRLLLPVVFSGLILSFTEWVTGAVSYDEATRPVFQNGKLLLVYGLYLILLGGLSVWNLAFVYRHSSGRERKQTRIMLMIFVITLLFALITNIALIMLFPNWQLSHYGPLASALLVGIFAFSAARFGPFDISPSVIRSVGFLLSTLAITAVFATAFNFFLELVFEFELSSDTRVYIALFFAASVLLALPAKQFFDWVLGHVFGRVKYDSQKVLNNINSKIATVSDLEELLKSISTIIQKQVQVEFSSFYLKPHSNIEFHLVSSRKQIFADKNWTTINELLKDDLATVLAVQDLADSEPLREPMMNLNIELIIRLSTNDDTVGYMIIGKKKNRARFNALDLEVLNIIAGELAQTVQNALRYREIQRFNETLKDKVDEATKELKHSNQKLLALDDAKDEFISMASHQLRTPLTSIKGYISMIVEGDMGEVPENQKQFLNQTLLSCQRVIYTISDLLNLSRLKTGKFVIEPKDIYLPEMVQTEVEQLRSLAESRGLRITCTIPERFPRIRLDESKTRQVIMNFVDNAIHYSKAGGEINVLLRETSHTVELIVKDQGIGVPVSERQKLFTKFYRASNARKARPDGTGLGLFITKKVIAAQGGTLIFTSEEGAGSTFGFSFPKSRIGLDEPSVVRDENDLRDGNWRQTSKD